LDISFDRIADRYDTSRSMPEEVMEEIMRAMGKLLPKDALILDAGVGTGRYALPMQARGFEVIGVDISEKMLEKAREKGVQDLLRGNLGKLPFKDKAFDHSISVHVLHLIEDWRGALDEIGRVTKNTFMSVASDKSDSPAQEVRDAYEQACMELGHDPRHPGLRERELPDIIEPDEALFVTAYEEPVDVPEMIDEFSARSFSNQWMVPEDIHAQAIALLRERFEGVEELIERQRFSIIVWNADRLRGL